MISSFFPALHYFANRILLYLISYYRLISQHLMMVIIQLNIMTDLKQFPSQLPIGQDQSEGFFASSPLTQINPNRQIHKYGRNLLFMSLCLFFITVVCQPWKATYESLQTEGNEIKSIKLKTEQIIKNKQSTFHKLDPAKMQRILEYMMKRPEKKNSKSTHNFKPTQHAYFAYNLYQQPNNKKFLDAQYFYYETKYNISNYPQLPLCIVAPGRNLEEEGRYTRFFSSIAKQNYSNYKLVYIDDASTDDTYSSIAKYLTNPELQYLYPRTKLWKNSQRLYALANRNSGIRNFCEEDDIIIDIDPDDIILGQQAFKFINSVYQNPQVWIFYTNYVFWSSKYDEPSQGISGQIPRKILEQNNYRISDLWLTSATRTFRRKVYMKIDDQDFKDEKGEFYKWSSDLFMHYSLVELAGYRHYKYLDEIFYYYYLTHNRYKASEKALDKWTSYTLTSYQPLKSLEDEGRKVENYKVPQWILNRRKKVEEDVLNGKAIESLMIEEAIDKKYFQFDIHRGP